MCWETSQSLLREQALLQFHSSREAGVVPRRELCCSTGGDRLQALRKLAHDSVLPEQAGIRFLHGRAPRPKTLVQSQEPSRSEQIGDFRIGAVNTSEHLIAAKTAQQHA